MSCLHAHNALPMPGIRFPPLNAVPKFEMGVNNGVKDVQVALDMAALVALGAAASATHAGYDVIAPWGCSGPISLFIEIIAGSGTGKSAITNYMFKGFTGLKEKLQAQHNEDDNVWKKEHFIWKTKLKNIKKILEKKILNDEDCDEEMQVMKKILSEEPVRPVMDQLISEELTRIAIISQLNKPSACVTVVSSEAGKVMNGSTFEDPSLLDDCWSASPIRIARNKSESIEILNPRLSLMILVQHVVMFEYMKRNGNKSRGIGFWARFLICAPVSTQGYRLNFSENHLSEEKKVFDNRIEELAEKSHKIACGVSLTKYQANPSIEAKVRLIEVKRAIEIEMRPSGRFYFAPDHASRLAENILRVAAVLHVFEGYDGDIRLDVMELAISICFYCSDQFMSLFCGPTQEDIDKVIMRDWIQMRINAGRHYVKKANIPRFGPFRVVKRAYHALDNLIADGLISEFTIDNKKGIDYMPNNPFEVVRAKWEMDNWSH